MKIVIPIQNLHLNAILDASADFVADVFGDRFLFSVFGVEKDCLEYADAEDVPLYEKKYHIQKMEEKFRLGETLVLGFAEPNEGGQHFFRCADGKTYTLPTDPLNVSDDEYLHGDMAVGVLLLSLDQEAVKVQIETGILCGGSSVSASYLSRCSLGSLSKAAEEFVFRYCKKNCE